MSSFFAGVDDSDSDESVQEQQIQEVEENPWFVSDDEEDNQEDEKRISNAEKLKREAEEANDQLDLLIDEDHKQALDAFNEVIDKSRAYIKKERQTPEPLILAIIRVRDYVAEIMDGKEELVAEDFSDGQDMGIFKTFKRQNVQLEKEFKDDIERFEQGGGDAAVQGEDEDKESSLKEDWSEEGLRTLLARLPSEHKLKVVMGGQERVLPKVKICVKIVQEASRQNLPHIQIAALALQAMFIIDDATGTHLHPTPWKNAFTCINTAFSLSKKNPTIVVAEQDSLDNISAKRTVINGGFTVVAQQLFRELMRAFQFTQGHEAELVQRVKDEHSLLVLIDQLLGFYLQRGSKRHIARCASLLLEFVAPRRNNSEGHLHAIGDLSETELVKRSGAADSVTITRFLHQLVMTSTSEPYVQARATLLLAYNLAVAGKYQESSDIILQTKLHEASQAAPDTLCVLFNRVLAQLGLCAFRLGKYSECNNLLGELCSKPNREVSALLGQDIVRDFRAKYSAEKELMDRERLVPPHHAISLQLLEAASLVSAMFVGLVVEAKKPNAPTTRAKHFQRLINQQNYALITGGAADHKESIYVAYSALQESDVSRAADIIKGMSVWSLIADRDTVLERLESRMKEDSLKVFLVTYGCNFASLTVEHLSKKFSLTVEQVRSYVSQLLLERDSSIVGFWDHDESCLTIERGNPSKLHHLIEQSVERLSYLSVGAQASSFKGKGKGMRSRPKFHR